MGSSGVLPSPRETGEALLERNCHMDAGVVAWGRSVDGLTASGDTKDAGVISP